ncbi:uncharacterized protein EDB91DRAFT_1246775 [Suillus paluster]|uniref:uncharacterized protein n=1 Tax=Suillus paluster TaxID=48578 RepID=UPI001B872227|nr:uncharacterized protein EDB91DRAFT_1246775 [Suillus paluster]KAG1744661.1 hypothetical protein EDB91DRAFT_1246775 [Suillus paluster]
MSAEDQSIIENMMADFGMEVEVFMHTAPPGEEAFDLSHTGGEHEAFKGLAHQLADLTVITLTHNLGENRQKIKQLIGTLRWIT